MNNNPLVSVIVPCYNHEQYVKECILSIVNQTYKNIQLIVIDDGSTDSSYYFLQQIKMSYDFILEHRSNHGLTKTLNYAISNYATGKYITLIASDDYWEKDKIEKQVSFMELNGHLALSCAKAKIVDDQGNVIGSLADDVNMSSLTFESLLIKNIIPALTVIFKKQVFENVGGFDENLYYDDWDFWLRIADKFKIGFLDEYVAFYRKHESNMSHNYLLMIENSITICNKWSNHPAYDKTIMEQNFNKIFYLTKQNKGDGLIFWLKNFKYFYNIRYWKMLINFIK